MTDRPAFVFFDLDDTLLDHRHAERHGLADLCTRYADHFAAAPLAIVQETYHRHSVPLWQQYAAGTLGKDDVQRLRFERTLAELGVGGLDAWGLNEEYLRYYAHHWRLSEAAREAFLAIAEAYPVGLLTNGFAEVQHAKLRRFPDLRDRSRVVVISEEVGFLKPHPRIFAHAAAEAAVPPASILYVGDSLSSDVQGALGAGWQSAWLTEAGEAPPGVFRFAEWEALTGWLLEDEGSTQRASRRRA